MATQPLTVNVAPALRQDGTVVQTQVLNFTGQYSSWSGTFTGLGTGPGSDYENPANSLIFGVYYELPAGSGIYILGPGGGFTGGPRVKLGVTDPPIQWFFPLDDVPHGNVRIQAAVTGTFTVGFNSTFNP